MALPDISTMPTPFVITKEDQELARSLIETIRLETNGAFFQKANVVAILNAVADGRNVLALSEMSPDEAASYLDIPESEMDELIRSRAVESSETEHGLMVPTDSLEQYKRQWKRQQRAGLDALARQAQELGLYDE